MVYCGIYVISITNLHSVGGETLVLVILDVDQLAGIV